MGEHSITKSEFVDGLRCEKLLWLSCNERNLRSPPSPDERRRLRQGNEVEKRAREEFPGGRLIVGVPFDMERARAETRAALAGGASVLFQPVFEHDGVLVVVDILRRDPERPEAWQLVEVKASNELKKPHYVRDVAVQAHVLRSCGQPVSSVFVMHLNREYVHPDGGELFVLEDVSEAIEAVDAPSSLRRLRAVLGDGFAPGVVPGPQCRKPYDCSFKDACWSAYGKRTIFFVPNPIHHTRIKKLRVMGIVKLEEIPESFPLSADERAGVDLILKRERQLDRDAVRAQLGELAYPIHFLDFETIDDALPRLKGTHPYQKVPFQFSCHVLYEDRQLEHFEYLHEDVSDPRPPLLKALRGGLSAEGSIVAYFARFERERLEEMARDFPQHADWLQVAVRRLWDQREVFVSAYVDYRFEGSTSIKKVLPVLCPDLSYEGMDVANGTEAMVVWEDVIFGRSADPAGQLAALREYCEQDTYAMVRIHDVLHEAVV